MKSFFLKVTITHLGSKRADFLPNSDLDQDAFHDSFEE
jgi:hypothetical protein